MKHKFAGQTAYKLVVVKIFTPRNTHYFKQRHCARPGNVMTSEAVEKMLDSVADQIEERFPGHDYELVELGGGNFNFVWRGHRVAAAGREAATS